MDNIGKSDKDNWGFDSIIYKINKIDDNHFLAFENKEGTWVKMYDIVPYKIGWKWIGLYNTYYTKEKALWSSSLHRVDGPAVTPNYNSPHWVGQFWLDGKEVTQYEHIVMTKVVSLEDAKTLLDLTKI